jgi:hypothetical protein
VARDPCCMSRHSMEPLLEQRLHRTNDQEVLEIQAV